MWPVVRDGALLEVTPYSPTALEVGEIAAYEREGGVVVHRVVGLRDDAILFGGDGLDGIDVPVPHAAVLGRAVVIEQPRLYARLPTVGQLRLLARASAVSLGRRASTASIIAYARADALATRAQRAVRFVLGGLLDEVLTAREKTALTVQIYEHLERYGRADAPLLEWEVLWFAKELPPAPAAILVCAAGSGREVARLREQGYRVDAFDPSPGAVAECEKAVAGAGEVRVATYQDFARAVLAGDSALPFADRRYDAIILGWESFSHVLDETERKRLVRACDRLTPSGPILASFWLRAPAAQPQGRAERAGRRLGRLFGHARRMPAGGSTGTAFGSWFGFAYSFTRDEIGLLGATVSREVRWGTDLTAFPHATFLPPGSRTNPDRA